VTPGPYGAPRLDRAIEAVRGQHWAAIEQLVQGVAAIPWSPVEASPESHDDWAEVLVQAAAFAHIRVSPSCRGFTTLSSGRVGCYCCGWGMSARTADVGTPGSTLFSQAAISRVGQAVALAVGEVVQTLFEAVLPC
jgi:hypothetical protein